MKVEKQGNVIRITDHDKVKIGEIAQKRKEGKKLTLEDIDDKLNVLLEKLSCK